MSRGLRPLPVTVISGFPGSGKTSLLNHLLAACGGMKVAVVVNDVPAENAEVRADLPSDRDQLTTLSDGCICCTGRENLLQEVLNLAAEGTYDYLLIETSGFSEPMPLAEVFAYAEYAASDESAEHFGNTVQLDTMVTVIDAEHFLDDFQSQDEVRDRIASTAHDDDRDIPLLLAEQIEFADVVVLNKTDRLNDSEQDTLHALIRRLNPQAVVIDAQHGQVAAKQVINTGLFQANHLNESIDQDPGLGETDEFGLSAFTFAARRPFHPQRFLDFWMAEDATAGILRSKGCLWLASRSALSGYWSQAGSVLSAEAAGPWWATIDREDWPEEDAELIAEIESVWTDEVGDCRQELTFIGQDLNREELCSALDACLLTDSEMAEGPDAWQQYEDPFAPWSEADDNGHIHDENCQHDHDHG